MLVMGSIMVGAGALLVGLLALLFRHPGAPRWTRPELVAMLAVIPLAGLLGLGLGYVAVGGYRLLHGAGHLYELGAPLAAAIVIAGFWQLSGLSRRLQAYDAAGAGASLGAAAMPLPEGSPTTPAPPPASPGSARAA